LQIALAILRLRKRIGQMYCTVRLAVQPRDWHAISEKAQRSLEIAQIPRLGGTNIKKKKAE